MREDVVALEKADPNATALPPRAHRHTTSELDSCRTLPRYPTPLLHGADGTRDGAGTTRAAGDPD